MHSDIRMFHRRLRGLQESRPARPCLVLRGGKHRARRPPGFRSVPTNQSLESGNMSPVQRSELCRADFYLRLLAAPEPRRTELRARMEPPYSGEPSKERCVSRSRHSGPDGTYYLNKTVPARVKSPHGRKHTLAFGRVLIDSDGEKAAHGIGAHDGDDIHCAALAPQFDYLGERGRIDFLVV
jgi:hypothetical protein